MDVVKVTSKNQIVIPKKARKALGIRVGDEILVEVKDGVIEAVKRPESYAEYTRGLGAHLWKGLEAQEYVRKEREGWERKAS